MDKRLFRNVTGVLPERPHLIIFYFVWVYKGRGPLRPTAVFRFFTDFWIHGDCLALLGSTEISQKNTHIQITFCYQKPFYHPLFRYGASTNPPHYPPISVIGHNIYSYSIVGRASS
ncbi:hypothetical protein TNCV_3270621 [Trichonephila clavipes]|nr:hypothetical protein TNCV_3270621 [Trichonephila clavipes]